MWLRRPRSPTICHLQAREPGSCWCDSVESESLRTGSTHVQGQEKTDGLSSSRESKFALLLPSGSIRIGEGDLLYPVG